MKEKQKLDAGSWLYQNNITQNYKSKVTF